MLLGLAVGDALGNGTEAMTPSTRAEQHGRITHYLPNPCAGGRQAAPSDDTQLTFYTLDQVTRDGGLDPERLAARFAREPIWIIGRSVERFVQQYRAGAQPWYRASQPTAGNGALMRIAASLVPHLRHPTPELWADAALAALVTHNDRASTSASLAFAAMLWELLALPSPPPADWWVERYVALARPIEDDATRYRPRGGAFTDYAGPLWPFVAERVPAARRRGLRGRAACDAWHSGAYLLETVPSLLYLLACLADDPEAAIVEAVNGTYDNDTVAALVGAAVGALHGVDALPRRWLTDLTGQRTGDDDGHLFAILADARRVWYDPPKPEG